MVIFSLPLWQAAELDIVFKIYFSRYTKKMINKNYSYEEITKLVLAEQKKISNFN